MFLQKSAVAKGTVLKEGSAPELEPGPLEVRAANGRRAARLLRASTSCSPRMATGSGEMPAVEQRRRNAGDEPSGARPLFGC